MSEAGLFCWDGTNGPDRDPAIDEDGLPGDISTGVGRQPDDSSVEIPRCAGPIEGDSLAQIIDPTLVFVHNPVLLCPEPAGSEAVDSDTVGAPVVG